MAEVLITLGIIGVIAAMTLPHIVDNIQARIRSEQIRTVKYKFTKATDKMATLDLIGPYKSTEEFVNVLRKHFKISRICMANNISSCWPTETITLSDGEEYNVSNITSGNDFQMDTSNTKDYSSPNVGIITVDGTPMILSYNTKCEPLKSTTLYPWTTEDNKPVSNATTDCVAAVFEINGSKRPNKLNNDVILFNANGLGQSCGIEFDGLCFSSTFSPKPLSRSECEAVKDSLGIKKCMGINDYWAGAVQKCGGVQNMPTLADLASIGKQLYKSRPNIGADEFKVALWYDSKNASSLGFPGSADWRIFSGEEDSALGVRGRYFEWSSTNALWYSREDSLMYAICKYK